MPDDSDVYLRIAQIYRELHQLDKAEQNLVKARQYAPGSLEVMYNEAMLYQAQGRYEDAIRVLSDAVTGIKGQSPRCLRGGGRWPSCTATRAALSRFADYQRPFIALKNWGISARKRIAARE